MNGAHHDELSHTTSKTIKKKSSKKKKKKKKKDGGPKITMRFITQASLPRQCAKKMGYITRNKEHQSWDVSWSNTNGFLKNNSLRLDSFQKINHFPAMNDLARKDSLANNLNEMRQAVPKGFDFFPRTFTLPRQYREFKEHVQNLRRKGRPVPPFISKPSASCQGKGIELVMDPDSISHKEQVVLQRYLERPLLIDSFKFDCRIYVLVSSIQPLTIYLYKDGLARLATRSYCQPTKKNAGSLRMHLTNYSLNKKSQKFDDDEAEDKGSKRSLLAVFAEIAQSKEGGVKAVEEMWCRIQGIIVNTLICVQPALHEAYELYFGVGKERYLSSKNPSKGSACFELLGFDIFIDDRLRPWLIEVNHAPSFAGTSLLDQRIKCEVLCGAFHLVVPSRSDKEKYQRESKKAMAKKLWTTTPTYIHIAKENKMDIWAPQRPQTASLLNKGTAVTSSSDTASLVSNESTSRAVRRSSRRPSTSAYTKRNRQSYEGKVRVRPPFAPQPTGYPQRPVSVAHSLVRRTRMVSDRTRMVSNSRKSRSSNSSPPPTFDATALCPSEMTMTLPSVPRESRSRCSSGSDVCPDSFESSVCSIPPILQSTRSSLILNPSKDETNNKLTGVETPTFYLEKLSVAFSPDPTSECEGSQKRSSKSLLFPCPSRSTRGSASLSPSRKNQSYMESNGHLVLSPTLQMTSAEQMHKSRNVTKSPDQKQSTSNVTNQKENSESVNMHSDVMKRSRYLQSKSNLPKSSPNLLMEYKKDLKSSIRTKNDFSKLSAISSKDEEDVNGTMVNATIQNSKNGDSTTDANTNNDTNEEMRPSRTLSEVKRTDEMTEDFDAEDSKYESKDAEGSQFFWVQNSQKLHGFELIFPFKKENENKKAYELIKIAKETITRPWIVSSSSSHNSSTSQQSSTEKCA